jgi:hypothetical protein
VAYISLTKWQGFPAQGGKNGFFKKWWCENSVSPFQRKELDPYIIPCMKSSSKWVKALNIRPDNVKLLEENIKGNLDINLDNDLFGYKYRINRQKSANGIIPN